MLSRETLPREELVSALLRACGATPDQVAAWRLARQQLAVTKPDIAEPQTAPRWWARRPVLAVGLAGLSLIAAGTIVALIRSGTDPAHALPEATTMSTAVTPGPAAGRVCIRSVHSGLCLTERRDLETGELFQAACDTSFPDRTLVPMGTGTYRVTTMHPTFGPGCMGVFGGKADASAAIADEDCHWRGQAEDFRLEAVTTPLPGFRIHPVHSGLCVEVLAGSDKPWTSVRQMPCDLANAGQVFTFEQVP